MQNKNKCDDQPHQEDSHPITKTQSASTDQDDAESAHGSKEILQPEIKPKSFTPWSFWFEFILVIATCTSAGVAFFQWQAMKSQSDIMKGQLTAAQDSIEIAKKTLEDARKSGEEQSARAERLTKANEIISNATIKSANAANKSASAANESNKLNRETLIAQQRPWISVDAEIAGPLAFDGSGWSAGTRWHVPLKYRLQQLGITPAKNVFFFAEIIPFTISHWPSGMIKNNIPQGAPITGTDVAKEIEAVCGFPESMSKVNMGFGQLLFRGESKDSLFGLNGNPARFNEAKRNQGYGGQFLVVVCTTYESTFSRESYRTAKAFHLYKLTGNQRIDLNGENVPLNELGFTPSPQQIGSYAN